MLAKHNIQNPKKKVEAFVLVYHHNVEEDSEFIKDLEKKYLSSIVSKTKIKLKQFRYICQGD